MRYYYLALLPTINRDRRPPPPLSLRALARSEKGGEAGVPPTLVADARQEQTYVYLFDFGGAPYSLRSVRGLRPYVSVGVGSTPRY